MRRLASFAVALFLLLAAAAILNDYWVYVLAQVFLAACVTLGLTLMGGIAGMNSFGQTAFVGVAAYAVALGSTRWGLPAALVFGLALLLPLLVALVFGAVTVTLSGHYLPLSTIAWALAIGNFFGNADGLGGFQGIGNIPPLSGPGGPIEGARALVLIGIAFFVLLALSQNLLDSRPGRALRAIGIDRVMPECMGINTGALRLAIFLLAAAYAALAGFFYAHLQRFVSPSPFNLDVGLEYMFMALLGGSRSLWGAFAGALIMICAKEFLRQHLPALIGQSGDFDVVVFAIGLILLMQWMPQGITGWLGGRLRSHERRVCAGTGLARRERPPAGTPLLTVDGLTKRFGGLVANSGLRFALHAGEVLAVIGPNGAGKSTLFNLVSGVIEADAGTIAIAGRPTRGLDARRIMALGLVRTFQHVKLTPDMSVIENIALGTYRRTSTGLLRAMLRLDRREEAIAFAEAAAAGRRCGLEDRLNAAAGSLPLGLQRLVEVARALASDPLLLILDEPAAGLRGPEKERLAQLIASLRADGLGVLLVEHDMEFVMGLADRIVVMNFGTVLAEGQPAEVRANPDVLDAYLGVAT